MQGGVFGWVSDSGKFVKAIKSASNNQKTNAVGMQCKYYPLLPSYIVFINTDGVIISAGRLAGKM